MASVKSRVAYLAHEDLPRFSRPAIIEPASARSAGRVNSSLDVTHVQPMDVVQYQAVARRYREFTPTR
jgi:hypothetical protein